MTTAGNSKSYIDPYLQAWFTKPIMTEDDRVIFIVLVEHVASNIEQEMMSGGIDLNLVNIIFDKYLSSLLISLQDPKFNGLYKMSRKDIHNLLAQKSREEQALLIIEFIRKTPIELLTDLRDVMVEEAKRFDDSNGYLY